MPVRPPVSLSYLECATYKARFGPIWPLNRAFVFLRRISANGRESPNLGRSKIRKEPMNRGDLSKEALLAIG
jgi:hypothetical protein